MKINLPYISVYPSIAIHSCHSAEYCRKNATMASYTQPAYPTHRTAAARPTLSVDSTKGLSAMLLAAMVSALVVVANQLMDTWVDGHLMLAWIALWVVGFSAIAVFAGAARKLAMTAVGTLDAWSQRVARGRADKRLWVIAKSDPRVMADLNAAKSRSQR